MDYISDTDSYLANFLSNCTPERLELLALNYFSSNSITGIKSKFYVDAFSRAAVKTIKEVYFTNIDFSSEDLQAVVRAACNVERIVFCNCCIHCSSGFDFGVNLKYKTKYLSFQHWEGTYHKELTMDWKADPSKFSLIVDAIGSSGLKASLQKLGIYYNQTLSAFKVQEELSEKDMEHISVVRKWSAPLTS